MRELDARLADVPGTVSVWIGPLGGAPRYTREPAATHYAASLMKLPLLAAIDQPRTTEILVHNDFASVASGRFGLERRHDSDDAVWRRLGERVTLGWLAERMITYSSNLAANLILERIGIGPADGAWRQVGARHSTLSRGIGDGAAARVGHTNLVTAADLARLLGWV
jgi:beta-lactamase class A